MMMRHNNEPVPKFLVQKYGGTSVATPAQIQRVATRALEAQRSGLAVLVVVSAMSGETNRLMNLAHAITPVPARSELDVVAAAGEQVTAALTALAIVAAGGKAKSFLAHQIKIKTDSAFGDARISTIETARLKSLLQQGDIPVIAGFQGVDAMENITTLGRGGSDTTAVALAAAMGDSICEIYTDVEGVYSADPSICPDAKKFDSVSYQHMLALASLGAKVLHERSVAIGEKYAVPIHVRSSFSNRPGTWVLGVDRMEPQWVQSITQEKNVARVSWIASHPAVSVSALTQWLSNENISIDMADTLPDPQGAHIRFSVKKSDVPRLQRMEKEGAGPFPGGRFFLDNPVTKISVVSAGTTPNVKSVGTAANILESHGIEVLSLSSRETAFSFLIRSDQGDAAVRCLHSGFEFKAPSHPTLEKKEMSK